MRQKTMNPVGLIGPEPGTIPVGILDEGSSPASLAREPALTMLSVSALAELCQRELSAYRRGEPSPGTCGLELLRRAIEQADQQAWTAIELCLGGIVRGWLHCHPNREVACRLESEENYIAFAFERFWHATVHQQVQFRTFAGALVYLRASLNGAILDALRAYARPREVTLPEPGAPDEPFVEENTGDGQVWEILQTMLPSERERRLVYLLFHCELKPGEIVRFCPQEWSDVQEIYRLRRSILDRLIRNADQLRWRLNASEP